MLFQQNFAINYCDGKAFIKKTWHLGQTYVTNPSKKKLPVFFELLYDHNKLIISVFHFLWKDFDFGAA